MNQENLWKTKLAARLHDPAEKALILLRDPVGHENGTSRALRRLLGFDQLPTDMLDADNDDVLANLLFKSGLPMEIYRHVQRADWWAAAADRPQWPMQEDTFTTKKGIEKTFKVANFPQVRWTKQPVLLHPLSGASFDLGQHGGLNDTEIGDIKQRSFAHFSSIVKALERQHEGSSAETPWKELMLAFWRFGPELNEEADNGKLGALWNLLPADTRVPDHSIWDHLDLTSAFAGAFAADPKGEVALLALSIGPVQPFIAAARSTSDLWAGSHLLARLAWETMKPLCEELGPDAILFPRLRGVPQVDLWLRDTCKLPTELFKDCEWLERATDSNPLFAAALPNRFVAIVPAAQAAEIAKRCESHVREWLQTLGIDVVDNLLEVAGLHAIDQDRDESVHAYQQMREQLAGFPEVHWAAVPFSLARPRNTAKQTDLDTTELSLAMAPFFGVETGEACGFLDSAAWKVLSGSLQWSDNTTFFSPNPGVLYPAVADLAERVLAAAKATRAFAQQAQGGWRDSLTGESEWLTHDPKDLQLAPGQRTATLWAKIAQNKPAWARPGEHLGALSAIKRLWPTLYSKDVAQALGDQSTGRFVVSTHAMALSQQIDQWLKNGGRVASNWHELAAEHTPESVALPRKLIRTHVRSDALDQAKLLPAFLDKAREDDSSGDSAALERLVKETLGVKRLETYYAFVLLDGDHMGRILAGDHQHAITYEQSFHPQVREGFAEHAARQPALQRYGKQKRALSPNRHLAISAALNDFSLTVVRHVVESEFMGRVIYAGGDDVLAMLPVSDFLPCMQRLRYAYSGDDPQHKGGVDQGLTLKAGFAVLKTKRGRQDRVHLMRMMGTTATASAGAVIAHHQAPLGMVLRELRAAEQRAKRDGGRDAFSLSLIKRSGGMLQLTAKWGKPLEQLIALRNFLSDPSVSRRAVYHSLEWLRDLPEPAGEGEMLKQLLAYQFERQSGGDQHAKKTARDLASSLTELALESNAGRRGSSHSSKDWLQNFLSVAEFLARETHLPEEPVDAGRVPRHAA